MTDPEWPPRSEKYPNQPLSGWGFAANPDGTGRSEGVFSLIPETDELVMVIPRHGPRRLSLGRRQIEELHHITGLWLDTHPLDGDPCTCGHDLVRHDMGHGCIECRCRGFTEPES